MKFSDKILGLIIFIVGISICLVAKDFPNQNDGKPGPWLFPVVLSLLFAASGLILFIKATLAKAKLSEQKQQLQLGGFVNVLILLVLILFYIFISETLGFLISMEIVMLSMMLLLKTKPLLAIIVSVLAVLAIYLIFVKVLLVPLPEGIFYF